jgi:hypothetical protein
LQPESLLFGANWVLPASTVLAQEFEAAYVRDCDVNETHAVELVLEAIKRSAVSARVSGHVIEVNYFAGEGMHLPEAVIGTASARAKPIVLNGLAGHARRNPHT